MPLLANNQSAKAASAIQTHPAPGITIATARNRKHPRQFQSHWPAMRSSAKMCPSRTSGIRNQPSAYRAAPKPKNNVHTITKARTSVGLQPSRKAMPLHTPPIHRSSPRTSPLDRTQVKKRRDVLFFLRTRLRLWLIRIRVWIAHDSITPPDHCHNARGTP